MIVALYARVSTARQAEKDLSIPDQFRQMRDWCKQQGYSIAIEYEEAGASATDDRRPAFQQMINDACSDPAPYDAIIIHSLSRFFRDAIEFGLYERQLNKHGVNVISITQQTSNDPAGDMAKKIFSLFDEYQSKENAKHTLRAMKENARQGYFNGSKPPYGYRTIEVEAPARSGKKKRLEVDLAEAAIVSKIFNLYSKGEDGKSFSIGGLAAHLNQKGITRRGKKWNKPTVANLLGNETYIGNFFFNKKCNKTRKTKPQSEWVLLKVPPIIEKEIFENAQRLKVSRSPENVPPRIVGNPTLLTGLLKCSCGSSMTIATGKGGRYRYYKCTSKINLDETSCTAGNIPMEKLDQLILDAIAERVFTPDRVGQMLKEFRKRLKNSRSKYDTDLRNLKKELDKIQEAIDRLYAAVEEGILPTDITLKERVHKHQARRQEILIEMAGLKKQAELPQRVLGNKNIQLFCDSLRTKLQDRNSKFGKDYLRMLIDEIKVEPNEIKLRGSYDALAGMLNRTKAGTPWKGVPAFGMCWLPEQDSNLRQGG